MATTCGQTIKTIRKILKIKKELWLFNQTLCLKLLSSCIETYLDNLE